MKYAIGKEIKVKSFEEIKKTLDKDNYSKGLFFNDSMKIYCGKTYKIDSYASTGPYYQLESCEDRPGQFWKWAEEWVELVPKFKPGDLVVVKPDLIIGNVYGEDCFIEEMEEKKGTVVTIKEAVLDNSKYRIEEGGYYYTKEMLLTLDEAFTPGRAVCKKDGSTFSNKQTTVHVNRIGRHNAITEVWFEETKTWLCPSQLKVLSIPSTETIETGNKAYLDYDLDYETENIADLDYKIKVDFIKSNVIYSDLSNPIKNKKDYENQLQREKTRIRGAEVPEGSRICSRKRKAAIVFGHLSNKARTGY